VGIEEHVLDRGNGSIVCFHSFMFFKFYINYKKKDLCTWEDLRASLTPKATCSGVRESVNLGAEEECVRVARLTSGWVPVTHACNPSY
jgi:hypothetical protein